MLSVLALNRIGRFLLDEGLVDPEYVSEHDSVLIVFQRLKDLFYPISASRTYISVVERRYAEAFVLKKMDEEFDPFGQRNLSGIEKASCQRIESSSAGKATIFLCAVFPFPVPFDRFGMAVRALFHLKRIDERYLVYRKRLVLCIVPSFAFVIDERGKREISVKFRKRGPQRERIIVLLVFHGGLCAHRKENEDTNRQVIGFVSLPMNPIFCLFQGKKIIPLKAAWPATMCKPVFS